MGGRADARAVRLTYAANECDEREEFGEVILERCPREHQAARAAQGGDHTVRFCIHIFETVALVANDELELRAPKRSDRLLSSWWGQIDKRKWKNRRKWKNPVKCREKMRCDAWARWRV